MQKAQILGFQIFFCKLNSGPSSEGILKIKKDLKILQKMYYDTQVTWIIWPSQLNYIKEIMLNHLAKFNSIVLQTQQLIWD